MRMRPAVSVIIPTCNRAAMVGAAIASVIAQRVADGEFSFELIVIDDGSADGTWRELERTAATVNRALGERLTMRIARTENRGVAAARNCGIALAAAPLIALLDSDDCWGPDKLARQLAYMRAHPEYAIAQTDEWWVRDGVRVNPPARHRKRAGDIFIDALRTCLVTPSTVMIRNATLREAGGFDEDLTAAEDYDLWLRILVRHEIGYLAEYHATRHAGHRGQLSATVPAIDRFRILALLKLLGGHDLNPMRRDAVCDVIAEKCGIYAQGLMRRGRGEAAQLILGFAAEADSAWRADGAQPSAIAAAAAMRAQIRRDGGVSGAR
ncbi:MAG: glycosyltransferase family 2 protein [Candidatus Binataceae bacterium]|nr:glycosyltransferase family 2 protein [Candidatus Binataceae bacterium]